MQKAFFVKFVKKLGFSFCIYKNKNGYFWGILGMFVSTPIIASCKAIFTYFDDKYNLIKFNDEE